MAASDDVSFEDQKDAKLTLVYSSKCSRHVSVIRLKNMFIETKTTIKSIFAVQNASLCTDILNPPFTKSML